jgi:hypothetical protein
MDEPVRVGIAGREEMSEGALNLRKLWLICIFVSINRILHEGVDSAGYSVR